MKYLIFFIFFLSSCSSPKVTEITKEEEIKINSPIVRVIEDRQPSFDGNEQNSGIIDFFPDKGWLITNNALKRYNILIEKFGKMFEPSINKDYGLIIENNKNYLSSEAMIKFALMNKQNKLK